MADIQVALELDDSKYTPKLDTVQKKTKEFTDSAEKGFKIDKEAMDKLGEAAEKVKGKMESLGSVLAGVGIAEFVKGALEAAEKTVNMSEAMGVSIASMLEMNVAAAGVGKSADDVAKMMGKLEVAANNFANGTGKARQSFGELGISFNDLKTKDPSQIMSQAAHALASIEDPAKRAAIATDLFGKAGRTMNWKEYAADLDKAKGTQDEAADSMKAADEIMKSIKQTAVEVQTQFLMLAKPVLEWIGPFTQGTESARIKAEALVGVIALFGAGAALVGINSVVNAIRGMAIAFGLTAGAGKAEAAALQENTAVTLESTGSKIALAEANYTARVASLEMSIASMQEAGNMQGAAIATRQLVTAKANLAGVSAQAAVAVKMGAVSEAEEAVAANGATVATGRLAGAMGTLRTATATFLGPIGAAIAAIGSLAAVGQAIWGKNGIAHGGNGANFISDMLGITDSSGDEAAQQLAAQTTKLEADAKEQQKKMEEAFKSSQKSSTPMIATDTQAANLYDNQLESIKQQAAALKVANKTAEDRLRLEISMVGASNEVKAAKMAEFDAEKKQALDIAKLEQEKAKLKKPASGNTQDMKDYNAIIKLINQEENAIKSRNSTASELSGILKRDQDAEQIKLALLKDQTTVNKNIENIQQQIAEVTMSKTQVAEQAVTKEINAQVKVLEDLIVSQTHQAVTADQHAKIEAQVTAEYQKQKEAQDQLTAKQREFSTGWTQAWHEWQDNATNASQVGKSLFTSMIGNVDSAFKNMIHGTQTDWRSMVDNMVTMMMEADFNRLIATSIGSGKGSGSNTSGGGFFGGFADGGSIPAGGYGVVGENGPEYVNGPAKITPSGGASQIGTSSSTNVNYTIHANDAQSFKQMLAKDPQFLYAVSLKGQRGMPGGV